MPGDMMNTPWSDLIALAVLAPTGLFLLWQSAKKAANRDD